MVRATLESRKTMTRRICKKVQLPMKDDKPAFAVCPARESGWIAWFGIPDPNIEEFAKKAYIHGFPCPYGQPGDRLWVRETWQVEFHSGFHDIRYLADNHLWDPGTLYLHLKNRECWKKRPSIFMPRWASRITLEITGIKVERLQDISEEDAKAEGLEPYGDKYFAIPETENYSTNPRKAFSLLWEFINGKEAWEKNPWIWAISFKRIQ